METREITEEVVFQVETTFVKTGIPYLTRINIDRVDLDPILESVISKQQLSAFDWIQMIGTAVVSIGGLVASLFASKWDNCDKILCLIICGLLAIVCLVLPVILKNKEKFIQEVISSIDDRISCYQTYGMSLENWKKEAQKRIDDASQKLDDAIVKMKEDKKRMNNQIKKKKTRKP